jgi:hypothetical protein
MHPIRFGVRKTCQSASSDCRQEDNMAGAYDASNTADRQFVRTAMQAAMLAPEHEAHLARRWREQDDEAALHELTPPTPGWSSAWPDGSVTTACRWATSSRRAMSG